MIGRLFIGGAWVEAAQTQEVKNKYNGDSLGSVAVAGVADVQSALAAAAKTAPVMARLPAHQRATILLRTAAGLKARSEEFARLIAAEAGKALKFARGEVGRSVDIFTLAAEEAKRIHGETIPLDAVAAGEGYFGFWHRKPVGVVAAITPFNFPLSLVAHKLAPALAGGNTVVLKPAQLTPLSAILLCEVMSEAGLPAGAVNLVTGSGASLGEALVSDSRVALVTFTGSAAVGGTILTQTGIKKVALELGNNAPAIIAADADLDWAAQRCAVGAFYNSGQVCISTQRIYVEVPVFAEFRERLLAATRALVVGDPLDERTDVGPMIQGAEAMRVERWVEEAGLGGARALCGNRRDGAVYWPTVLSDTTPGMKVMAQEVFGPVVSIVPCGDFAEALRQADDTSYGLQAAVFTRDIDRMLRAMDGLGFGGLIVNDVPSFRADHMPYGGNRQSGLGREGVRFALEEMTNIQMVAIRRSA